MLIERAIVIVATPADLRSQPGPPRPRYVFVLSLGAVFQWTANSMASDDGFAVIEPNTGGYPGAWLRVRATSTASGAAVALGNADVHINVGQGTWFGLPAATLTADRAVVLDAANASAGDELELTRYDLTGFTYTLINGGPAGGTLCVMPGSSRSFAVAYFDGTNFVHRRSALML